MALSFVIVAPVAAFRSLFRVRMTGRASSRSILNERPDRSFERDIVGRKLCCKRASSTAEGAEPVSCRLPVDFQLVCAVEYQQEEHGRGKNRHPAGNSRPARPEDPRYARSD